MQHLRDGLLLLLESLELDSLCLERLPGLQFDHYWPALRASSSSLQVLHLKSQVLGGGWIDNEEDDDEPALLPNLRELDVSNSKRVSAVVRLVLRSCPLLECVDANYSDVADEDFVGASLRRRMMTRLTRLTRLTVNGCSLLTDGVLEHIGCWTWLQVLNLSQTAITGAGVACWLVDCTQLIKLFVSNCPDVTAQALAGVVRSNPHLQELGLSYCSQVDDLDFASSVPTLWCSGIAPQVVRNLLTSPDCRVRRMWCTTTITLKGDDDDALLARYQRHGNKYVVRHVHLE